jgi:hypothetical protein
MLEIQGGCMAATPGWLKDLGRLRCGGNTPTGDWLEDEHKDANGDHSHGD